MGDNFLFLVAYWLLVLSAFLTSYYSTKILYMTFWSEPRFNYSSLKIIGEGNLFLKAPLFILSLFSIASGYFFYDIFTGRGIPSRLKVFFLMDYGFELEYLLSQSKKFLPLFFVTFGIIVFFINKKFFFHLTYYSSSYPTFLRFAYITQVFFTKKWYFDYFYYHIAYFVMWLSYEVFFKTFDKGILEKLFVKEVVWGLVIASNRIKFVATGDITQYLLMTSTVLCLGGVFFFFQIVDLTFFLFILSYVLLVIFFSSGFDQKCEK